MIVSCIKTLIYHVSLIFFNDRKLDAKNLKLKLVDNVERLIFKYLNICILFASYFKSCICTLRVRIFLILRRVYCTQNKSTFSIINSLWQIPRTSSCNSCKIAISKISTETEKQAWTDVNKRLLLSRSGTNSTLCRRNSCIAKCLR